MVAFCWTDRHLRHRKCEGQSSGVTPSKRCCSVDVGDEKSQEPCDGTATGRGVCDLRSRAGGDSDVVVWARTARGIAQLQRHGVSKISANEYFYRGRGGVEISKRRLQDIGRGIDNAASRGNASTDLQDLS